MPRRFNDLTKALPPSRYDAPLASPRTRPSSNPSISPAASPAPAAADMSPTDSAQPLGERHASNLGAAPQNPASLECLESVSAYKAAYRGYVERLAQQVRTHAWKLV